MPEVVLYVPAHWHPATASIAPASAIVGRPKPEGDDVLVYFEGNTRGASNIRTLADRALHACGRMLQSYPTVAKAVAPRETLVAVGVFVPDTGPIVLTGPESEQAVAGWIGAAKLDPVELLLSDRGQGVSGGR